MDTNGTASTVTMTATQPEPPSRSPYIDGDPDVALNPRLLGLVDALLAARRDYMTMTTRGFGDRPRDLHHARQRYAHAALRYCAALEASGIALPHGLPETARWLLTNGDGRA
jgi:hypothetical protein